MADEKDNQDFKKMFDEAPDGPASTDGDHYDDEPGYGLNAAPHERDAKEAEAEFNRLAADAAQAAPEPKAKEQPAKFGDAFKEARAKHLAGEGPPTFTWNGKSFTTKLKGEVSSTTTAPARASTARAGTDKPAPKAATTVSTAPSVQPPASPPTTQVGQGAPSPVSTETMGTTAPAIVKPQQQSAPGASAMELRTHRLSLQKAYDDWQDAKNANSTWYGGKAIMRPGMKERETEAEQRYLNLLRNPR